MSDKPTGNPYIDRPNYYAGYQESIDKNEREKPNDGMDALCYRIFECTEDGKNLMKMFEDNFIYPGLANPASNSFQIDLIRFEGYKDAFRQMKNACIFYKQKEEANRGVK
jgi:hypothetical protein